MRNRCWWGIGLWLLVLPALAGAQGSAPAWEALQKQYAMPGERKVAGRPMSTAFFSADKTPIYQTVVDLRRGVDYLETVPEVDAKRVGYYGVSMGGILGGIAAGLDSRFRAPALVVAGGD